MDERSSQVSSIHEENTPISSKEASHSSTEATVILITDKRDVPHPSDNFVIPEVCMDEQYSNAMTSTNTSDISYPAQLAEGMENNIPTLVVHSEATSDSLHIMTEKIQYKGDNASSYTSSSLVESTQQAGSEETKYDLSRMSHLETKVKTLSKYVTEIGQRLHNVEVKQQEKTDQFGKELETRVCNLKEKEMTKCNTPQKTEEMSTKKSTLLSTDETTRPYIVIIISILFSFLFCLPYMGKQTLPCKLYNLSKT